MNTRKWLVSGFVLVVLVVAVLFGTQAAALRQSAGLVSIDVAPVFYSPSIESMINEQGRSQADNQVFYSPSIERIVRSGRTTSITNQIFYSPTIERIIRR